MRTCAAMASGKMGLTSPPLKSTQVNTRDLLQDSEEKICEDLGRSTLGGLTMTHCDELLGEIDLVSSSANPRHNEWEVVGLRREIVQTSSSFECFCLHEFRWQKLGFIISEMWHTNFIPQPLDPSEQYQPKWGWGIPRKIPRKLQFPPVSKTI